MSNVISQSSQISPHPHRFESPKATKTKGNRKHNSRNFIDCHPISNTLKLFIKKINYCMNNFDGVGSVLPGHIVHAHTHSKIKMMEPLPLTWIECGNITPLNHSSWESNIQTAHGWGLPDYCANGLNFLCSIPLDSGLFTDGFIESHLQKMACCMPLWFPSLKGPRSSIAANLRASPYQAIKRTSWRWYRTLFLDLGQRVFNVIRMHRLSNMCLP